MAGISSSSLKAGYSQNRKRFNGIENTTDLDLNQYEAFYRTLDPQLGRFMQIDPKPNEYEGLYNAMADNPIRFSDPLGDTLDFSGATDRFKEQFEEATTLLEAKGVGNVYHAATSMKGKVKVVETDGAPEYNPNTSTISWNPSLGFEGEKGVVISPTTILNHELDHAVEDKTHPKEYDKNTDKKKGKDAQYDNKEERRVITGTEQKTALALGEIQPGQVTRRSHKADWYPTAGPTSTKLQVVDALEKQAQQKKVNDSLKEKKKQ